VFTVASHLICRPSTRSERYNVARKCPTTTPSLISYGLIQTILKGGGLVNEEEGVCLERRWHQRWAHLLSIKSTFVLTRKQQFNRINKLSLICRSHQLVMEGFKYMFPERSLVTVWSAPNYCYRCGNVASILSLDQNLEREFRIFEASQEHNNEPPKLAFDFTNLIRWGSRERTHLSLVTRCKLVMNFNTTTSKALYHFRG